MAVGIACAALLAGAAMTSAGGGVHQDAAAQGAARFTLTPGQLRINQRISQAAVRRANTNRTSIREIRAEMAGVGRGPSGPPGPRGPAGAPGPVGPSAVGPAELKPLPALLAGLSSPMAIPSGPPIPLKFTSMRIDQGAGGYDSSTGAFTAGVRGIYRVAAAANWEEPVQPAPGTRSLLVTDATGPSIFAQSTVNAGSEAQTFQDVQATVLLEEGAQVAVKVAHSLSPPSEREIAATPATSLAITFLSPA